LIFLPAIAFVMTYLTFGEKKVDKPYVYENQSPIKREIHEPTDSKMTLPQGSIMSILAVGIDNTGQLADVILYAVIDSDGHSLDILQLPRDIYIGGDYKTGKLNEACLPFDSDDPAKRIKSILEERFCLPVDASVCVTMAAVRRGVDLIGGIPIDVPQRVEYLPGKIVEKGGQTLNGEQTEWLLRCRSEYKNADLGRLSMQKTFLEAAFKKAKSIGKKEAFALAAELYPYVKTDISLSDASKLLTEVSKLQSEDITFTQVPVYGEKANGLDVLCVNRYRLAETINKTVRKTFPISPWDLYLSYPPVIYDKKEEALTEEESPTAEKSEFDFSWYEEDDGSDALEGVVRRKP